MLGHMGVHYVDAPSPTRRPRDARIASHRIASLGGDSRQTERASAGPIGVMDEPLLGRATSVRAAASTDAPSSTDDRDAGGDAGDATTTPTLGARAPSLKLKLARQDAQKVVTVVNYKVTSNIKFRLLLCECLFSATTFAFMARQTEGLAGPELESLNDCGDEGCSYTKFFPFKGIVGIYASFFAYTVLLLGLYAIRHGPPPGTEFVSFVSFTAVMIFFVISSVVECVSVVIDSSFSICKKASYTQASLWFALGTICLNVASCYFSGKQWVKRGMKLLLWKRKHHFTPEFEAIPEPAVPV